MSSPNPSPRWHLSLITPWLLPTIIGGIVLGAVRSFNLQAPLNMILMTAIFALGAALGHLLFFADDELKRIADIFINRLAPTDQAQASPSLLRRGHFLLLVPIIGLFGLTTSRAGFGLGLIWGFSLQYALDIWRYWVGQADVVARRYFPAALDTPWLIVTVITGYLLYFVVLTIGLVRV